jgi:hypothetical protein
MIDPNRFESFSIRSGGNARRRRGGGCQREALNELSAGQFSVLEILKQSRYQCFHGPSLNVLMVNISGFRRF